MDSFRSFVSLFLQLITQSNYLFEEMVNRIIASNMLHVILLAGPIKHIPCHACDIKVLSTLDCPKRHMFRIRTQTNPIEKEKKHLESDFKKNASGCVYVKQVVQ